MITLTELTFVEPNEARDVAECVSNYRNLFVRTFGYETPDFIFDDEDDFCARFTWLETYGNCNLFWNGLTLKDSNNVLTVFEKKPDRTSHWFDGPK